ncbi:MAG: VOC family protein [Saprospiraceae bacterium]|nr:VOC family protein [Lewinella sp.]
MNMFYGSAPVFFVKDLHRSLDYYCDVLGFARPHLWGDPPNFAMPQREDIIIMLSQPEDPARIQPREEIWDAYFWVRDARKLYEEMTGNGAIVHHELTYKAAYGNLEFIIKDPDGYILAFGQGMTENAFYQDKPEEDAHQQETTFLYMCPVLASSDVGRDIRWYEEKLGFENVFDSTRYAAGPVNYAVLGRQKLYLHLQFQYPQDMTSTDVRIEVKNIQPLFREYLKNGVIEASAMRPKTAWGTNEFGLFDPSGNRLTFLEDL